MGEIVGAGLLSHVPTIVLPEADRLELNEGKESTLVTGLRQLRDDVFASDGYDTVVVLDSHWATTVEFVVTAQPRRSGLYTSEELPRGMCRMPYDFPGDPELAHHVASFADRHGTWITPIDDPYLPVYYATTNLWKYLGQGLPDKRWVTVGVCQTGDMDDHLRLGRALADGIAATPGRRVLLIASGALSHTFWPLRQLRDHEAGDPEHIFTPEARAADQERIAWFKEGRHDQVLDRMDDFWPHKPEARFFHYLMMAGALGERACTAKARQYGAYENAIGTGQVHLWFDRPADGWTGTGPPPPPAAARTPHSRVQPSGRLPN
ncbi:3,4-dihydroxyphenylacetate 2,3-dioxygenase [Streptomyces sp. NPDC047070]|uniref:3,4-dihydroxyphenylacetate 2,3-dioxygenase n=1 Tax=Streptomyces sp. NPDC047070 TaxID=3154923 RepID=UPI0034518B11